MSLIDNYRNSLFSDFASNGVTSDIFEIIDIETADIEKELDEVLSQLDQDQKGRVNYLISFRLFVSYLFEMFDNVGLAKEELDSLVNGFKSRLVDDEDELEEYVALNSIFLEANEKEDKHLKYLSFDDMFSYLMMSFDSIPERSVLSEFLSIRNAALNSDGMKLNIGV